jgi:hypothetical protein
LLDSAVALVDITHSLDAIGTPSLMSPTLPQQPLDNDTFYHAFLTQLTHPTEHKNKTTGSKSTDSHPFVLLIPSSYNNNNKSPIYPFEFQCVPFLLSLPYICARARARASIPSDGSFLLSSIPRFLDSTISQCHIKLHIREKKEKKFTNYEAKRSEENVKIRRGKKRYKGYKRGFICEISQNRNRNETEASRTRDRTTSTTR